MFTANDHVITRYTMLGTHTGPWMGLAPTGKKVSVPMMTIHRIRDGKIVEDWVLVGSLTLFQQLGVLPETRLIIASALKGSP
jgi:predicted ester cyclase